MKQTLKQFTPSPIWNTFSKGYWWWRNRGRHVFAQTTDPRWRDSRIEIARYKNQFRGKRCFIIGNGPSLKNMDLSLLANEVTFGLNRIYLIFNEIGFKTTFLVSVNDLVLEQCAGELQALDIPRFITWRARRFFKKDQPIIYLDTDFTGNEEFCPDATGRLFEGFTVTYVAMQLAYYMGFQQVILIGVDHNFTTKGTPNSTIISQGDDPNHFSGSYFGKGFRWQLPDLEGSERAYLMAKRAFDSDQRTILDASVGGKLMIFKKVEYQMLFSRLEIE